MAQQFPLTPELESIWQQMRQLQAHPNYFIALNSLDPATRTRCETLVTIPRVWLADGRSAQVIEAIGIIQAAMPSH